MPPRRAIRPSAPDGSLPAGERRPGALDERPAAVHLEPEIGLTRLYNEVDDGAYRDLRELHSKLDEAVAAAYGWPRSAAHDPAESNRRLLELNRRIVAGEVDYRPFG